MVTAWRWISSPHHANLEGARSGYKRRFAELRITANGFLNSCASVARNSSLRRSARCSVSSNSCCSVTSHTTPIKRGEAPSLTSLPDRLRVRRSSESEVTLCRSRIMPSLSLAST